MNPRRLFLCLIALPLVPASCWLSVESAASENPSTFPVVTGSMMPWWITTVETGGYTGYECSLALDAEGSPRISYFDFVSHDLKYAARRGSSWVIEIVDVDVHAPVGGVGTSLALDAEGNPHIAYTDDPNNSLKYATKIAGTWMADTVDAEGSVGRYPSIALDAQGNPRISYQRISTAVGLKYAERNAGVWTIETVDTQGAPNDENSLALDAQGNPRISYTRSATRDLIYVAKSGGVWTFETVDSAGSVGRFSSLALDVQGNPRISYSDRTNGNLKYAAEDGGVWALETADAAGLGALYTSLALDAQGNPRVSYLRELPNNHLRYAVRDAGVWMMETVDTGGSVGWYSSLALDAQGNPRVAYLALSDGLTQGDLRYASAAVEVAEPSPGVIWTGGDYRSVTWDGIGPVDLSLSTDGGETYQLLEAGLTGGVHWLTVPATPSESCKVRLVRASPPSESVSDSLFTIELGVTGIGPDGARPRLAMRTPYPNPRTGTEHATFRFSLPAPDFVTLALHDGSGRLVAERKREWIAEPGSHSTNWNPGRLPPGVYWVTLRALSGGRTQTKWVVLP